MTLLAGFDVVQLGRGPAAAVCGRILADIGAHVTCVDPDVGSPLMAYLNHAKAIAADERDRRSAIVAARLILREGQPQNWPRVLTTKRLSDG